MKEMKLQVDARAGDSASLLFLDWDSTLPDLLRVSTQGVAVSVRVSDLLVAVSTVEDGRHNLRNAQQMDRYPMPATPVRCPIGPKT